MTGKLLMYIRASVCQTIRPTIHTIREWVWSPRFHEEVVIQANEQDTGVMSVVLDVHKVWHKGILVSFHTIV